MSFYDDASLVFLPSGGAGKDTKAYSIKPTNGDGDFTFSRGSNLTATRIDSNGLIEKGRENLLVNSVWDGVTTDTKPTGWSSQLVSGTGTFDVTATEGQIRFQTLDASSRAFISSPTITTNGIVVVSVYVDEVNTTLPLNNLLKRSSNATDLFAYEDGVEINYSDNVQAGKRYSVVFNKTGSTNFRFGVGASDVALGDVVLSKPQIEVGLVATEWITSPIGSTGKAGLLENEPRFDYSGGASCPSLLPEPSRTNLIEYSEYFEGSGWTAQSGITLTANTTETLSPEGLNNAYKVVSTDATKGFYFSGLSITNAAVRTIYLKGAVGGETIVFKDPSGFGTPSTKTLTTDWQRFEMATTNDGNTYQGLFIDDISVGTIYAFGAQMEEGSNSSSYIPNHSGGSVTRDADITSVTSVSDLIGQTEGTIYCEFEYNGAADTGVFNRIIGLGTGVTQNRILLAKNDTTAELVAFAVTGGTTQVFQAISGTSIIGHHKVAISYKANEYKVYLDGELEFTDSSASVPATTDVYIGTAEDGTTDNELGGVVKQSIIFKEVLSEDNCKALTTI